MLWQFKLYTVVITYWVGITFMFCFPPRNFFLSGSKLRPKRDINRHIDLNNPYMNYNRFVETFENITFKNNDSAKLIRLDPPTFEKRNLIAVELKSDKHTTKPGILVIGALNAMTWAAPNAILEIAQRLLYDSKYQTPFFNDYDWYLVPMANPDGLEFTKTVSQWPPIDETLWSRNVSARNGTRPAIWYKNMDMEPTDVNCFGTNINRNFAYHWQDDVHKMPERCHQLYPGSRPFSSAETLAIRNYLGNISDAVELVIHLHASFEPKKEFILFPWRFSLRKPSNFLELQSIGEYAARNSRLPDGRYYEVHQSSDDERVAGTLSDYVAGVVGTDFVYLLKPYFPKFPSIINEKVLALYKSKATSAILTLVRGWRRNTKLNTLYFFGEEIEF